MKSLPISTIILAHQNTPQLQHAVQSAAFTREVIIIDTSGKRLIPKKEFTECTILRFPPVKNFSRTRNKALKHSKQPWVLFLDSDEVCICPDPNKLALLLRQPPTIYEVRRIDYFHQKPLLHGEPGHTWIMRLLPRPFVSYQGVVHEQVVSPLSSQKIDQNILMLHHFSHQSVTSFFSKVARYAQLEATQRATPVLGVWFQLLSFPISKFLYNLVWLRGLFDGVRGLIYATLMSYHSLLVRVFQIEQLQTKKK